MESNPEIAVHAEHITEDMFQHVCAYVGANLHRLGGKDQDYTLKGACASIQEGLSLPKGCSFKFRGYEMFLETPLPFSVKFGLGQLWIGVRNITLRFKEEVVSIFRYLISDLLGSALEELRRITYELNRKALKAEKLRTLFEANADTMIKKALRGTGLKYELSFHPFSATLKLWHRKADAIVAALHYDSFEDDLNKTISEHGNQYQHQGT